MRTAVFVVPILASVSTSLWLSKALPTPTGPSHLIGWWVLILGCSTSLLFIVDKASRKLLPLAALMQISMVFPDKAPKRFKTALKSGSSVKKLKEQLRRAEAGEIGSDLTEATEFILQMANALNTHDARTRGHAERVRAYSDMLAEELDVHEEDRAKLRWASLLHDIGKLKIPTEILNKPGQLDDEEWVTIKQHPVFGEEICAPLLEWLGPWADTIVDHHERFDGKGYPAGKKGDEISFGGRIVNVADAYDVMTTVRSYKKPMTTAAAREELARHAGAQFDPDVVRAFLNISMGRLRWIAGPLSWLAQMPFLNFLGAVQQVGTAVGVAGLSAAATAGIVGAGVLDIPDEPIEPVPVVEVVPAPVVVVTAAPDAANVNEDGSSAISVLSNDQVLAGTAVSIVDNPDFGSVVLNADGTVTYTPRPDFSGPDSFTYALVDDGEVSGTAVVSVTVIEINDDPTAGPDSATLDEDGSIDIDVLANDSDPEDRLDTGSLRVVSAPLNGTAIVVVGRITYTPDEDFAGTDAFVYAVDDFDGASVTATVEVVVTPVNDEPVIVADSASTDEDVAVTISVAANDSDTDGLLDPSSMTVISAPGSGTAVPSAGAILYIPDADVSGSDSFTYRLCDDGGACGIASVSVSVTAVNDPPVVPGPGPQATAEETTITIDLLTGASDIDGGPLFSIVPATSDVGAVLVDNGDGTADYTPPLDFFGADSFTYSVSDGAALVAIPVSVTVTDINDPLTVPGPGPLVTDEETMVSFDPVAGATDPDGDPVTLSSFDAVSAMGGTIAVGSLEYTPPLDFNGVDTFDYVATDGRGEFAPVTVTITVTAVNDAPVAVADSYAVAEDTLLALAAPAILGNDTDVDLDPLTATLATPPLHGLVVVNLDGSFSYTPYLDFNGDDAFTYTANDGAGGWDTATVTLTVTPVNDTPVANDDGGVGFTLAEDAATFTTANVVTANDTDVEDGTPDATTTTVTVAL
ncbi:MAG: tandem-95 repeat protein, partial [Acidimicrobiia bacterium]